MMKVPQIKYKGGYKYQTVEEYSVQVSVTPVADIDTDYIRLNTRGWLIISKGYAWDGPSGPAPDSPDFMRGSLVHDALYQLMRHDVIDRKVWRKTADQDFRRICREDGMCRIKAWAAYWAVRLCGADSASRELRREVQVAP